MVINLLNNKDALEKLLDYLNDNRFGYTMLDEFLVKTDDLYYRNIVNNFPSLIYKDEMARKLSLVNNENKKISINGKSLIDNDFFVIAGPCSIEDEESLNNIAKNVKECGAKFLRGGAYKPRTSPYSFQGIGEEGLIMLNRVARKNGLLCVSEIVKISDIPLFEKYVDGIQVGARNMQNFELLKALGKCSKPILLKRGFGNTIEEFLLAAEYIAVGGNQNIILCERGIRTFDDTTRNTLDLSKVALLKRLTYLPVIVDPSHAIGNKELIMDLLPSVVVSKTDGMMLEVHHNPRQSISDGDETLSLEEFQNKMEEIKPLIDLIKKVR